MKCILHIGTEKTGTTLLQQWLYSNQDVLSSDGIYLSDKLGRGNNRLFPAYFQKHLDEWAKAKRLDTLKAKDAFFEGFLEDLSAEIAKAAHSHETFVITSEHLHSRIRDRASVTAIHRFLTDNFDQVELVCYFRNQFDTAVSLYSTGLQGGATASLDTVLDRVTPNNYYYNYANVADLWSQIFGRGACNFRLYSRDRFQDGDIRKDFLSILAPGLDQNRLDYSVETANESLTLLQGAAFQAINKTVPLWLENNQGLNPANGRAKRELASLEALQIGRITSSRGAEILERFRESNDYFFKTYFGTTNQFAPDLVPPPSTEAIPLQQVAEIIEESVEAALGVHATGPSGFDAAELRDCALKIESAAQLTLEDALSLMKIARKIRPNGPVIGKKIRDWEQKLDLPSGSKLPPQHGKFKQSWAKALRKAKNMLAK